MFEISAGRWRASGFSGCLQTPRIEDPSNTQVGRAPWARAGIQIHNWGYPAGYPKLAGWLMEKPEKMGWFGWYTRYTPIDVFEN